MCVCASVFWDVCVCLIIKCRLTWQGSQRAPCPLLPVCTDISAASDNKVWFSQPPFWCDAIVVWANSRGLCSAIWSVAPQLWLQRRNFHTWEDASLWTLVATCARQKVRSKQSLPRPAYVSPRFSSHFPFGCSRQSYIAFLRMWQKHVLLVWTYTRSKF